ncbi:hypothetical protein B0T26DRAFT_436067 [Lasiosphaeria miniovina]|uniref:Uncharacterized protein n=1 Tax=Lasiosphaeria miniovina TaxID=1954250 RepID=A0AA40A713_9PEZI|nr:uncharacterized protein B0T26DRAFT_436067 [Lasiosphaeria miniovina]KAK0710338.1 hypothetical protein B0T26DRAFT_436067 [Lasiosphaeria miniovina]
MDVILHMQPELLNHVREKAIGRVDTAPATPATTGALLDNPQQNDPQQKPGTARAGDLAIGCIGNSDLFASRAPSTEGDNEPLHQRQNELGQRQESLEAQVRSIAQSVGLLQQQLQAEIDSLRNDLSPRQTNMEGRIHSNVETFRKVNGVLRRIQPGNEAETDSTLT